MVSFTLVFITLLIFAPAVLALSVCVGVGVGVGVGELLSLSFRVSLVGVKTRRMENKERKIWWKMVFSTVWLRGRGG